MLPEEDASEIWDATFSISNKETVPLYEDDFFVLCFLPFDLLCEES